MTRQRAPQGRLFWVLAAAGIILALAFIIGSTIQKNNVEASPNPNSSLRIGQVQRGDIEEVVRASGQVTARGTDLPFSASGVVSDVLVKPGQAVQAGQVLAKLDTREAEAQLQQAIAAQKAAQARLDTIQSGPALQLTQAQQDLKLAQARLDQAKAGTSTAADLAAAQAGVDQTVYDYNVVVSRPNKADVDAANAQLTAAKATLEQVKAGASKGAIDQANANLVAAQQNLEKVKQQRQNNVDQADTALKKAQSTKDAAQDTYDQIRKQLYNDDGTVKSGVTPADLEREKQAKVALEQAKLDLDQAGKNLQTAKDQQTSAVKEAEAQVNSADAALENLQAGPNPQAVASAQAEVDRAQAELTKVSQPATQDEINAAQAAINQAKANLDKLNKGGNDKDIAVAQAEVDKYTQLVAEYSKGALPSQTAEAQAALEQATAQVKQAQVRIDQGNLSAPFNSVVENIYITPGQSVSPISAAFSLLDLSGLSLEARVGQANIQQMRVGLPIRVSFQGISGVREIPFTGKITFVSLQAKPGTVINSASSGAVSSLTPASSGQGFMPGLDSGYPVSIVLDDDKQLRTLKPGMVGQVTVVLARRTDVLLVPRIAVRALEIGNVVDVVLADGTLVPTPVKVGLQDDNYVEIVDNTILREGDRIVMYSDKPVPPLPTPTPAPAGTPGTPGTPGATTTPGTGTPATTTPGTSTGAVNPATTTPGTSTSAVSPAATTPGSPEPTPILTPTPGVDNPTPAATPTGSVIVVTAVATTPATTAAPDTTGASSTTTPGQ